MARAPAKRKRASSDHQDPPSRLQDALRELAMWALVVGVVFGSAYYFLGETTVDATLDGRPVKAQVWVDGDYRGDTPLQTRLGPGSFEVEILPPDGVETNETEYHYTFWSAVIGKELHVDFTTMRGFR